MSRGPWLHNTSVPTKTTITKKAPSRRVLLTRPRRRYRAAGELPCDRPDRTAEGDQRQKGRRNPPIMRSPVDRNPCKRIGVTAAVAITGQARNGDTECTDLITIVTVLAKSSSRATERQRTEPAFDRCGATDCSARS